MSRNEIMYLQDIAQSCRKILTYTNGFSFDNFIKDEKTYDAVIRNLEIVGEAAKNVPEKLRAMIPDIEWRKAAGLRDMLAHAYFGIDNDILWDVIKNKIPQLDKAVNNFLKNCNSQ